MAAIVERKKVSSPMLAKEWGVSSKKIIAFIENGELRAINVATLPDQRPRYLIDRADIEAFERSREVVPSPAVPRVRRKTSGGVKNYFPD